MTDQAIENQLREILKVQGKVAVAPAAIGPDDDLYGLGLSSLATVNVMLEIEARFDIAFPDDALTRATFQTLGGLAALVRRQLGAAAAA
ncbi:MULTISPECIES: acyl carrier protein [Azorhizobium]|uniref:acyl carrier protein n=1 Tax=Azorhizobium TaxID=6 RepID=UPI0010E09E08|nr:acyl carrier protein [Azorhizobium sp. AG788]TDT89597.1 acyl carrier protein [Azorhizobium sp. AG788]